MNLLRKVINNGVFLLLILVGFDNNYSKLMCLNIKRAYLKNRLSCIYNFSGLITTFFS